MLALLTFDVSSGVSILAYLAIGVGCLVAVHVRAPHEPKATLLLMVPLWPVLAATALGSKSGQSGDVMARLDRVLGPRERKALDGFHSYLSTREERLARIRAAQTTAPVRVRQRLKALEQTLVDEIATGQGLLEELAVQVTLAELATPDVPGESAADRLHVEALVARLEAVIEVATEPVERVGS